MVLESFGRHPRDFLQTWVMALACISTPWQLYRSGKLRVAVGLVVLCCRSVRLGFMQNLPPTVYAVCPCTRLLACLSTAYSGVISQCARSFPGTLYLPVALHASPVLRTDCKPS